MSVNNITQTGDLLSAKIARLRQDLKVLKEEVSVHTPSVHEETALHYDWRIARCSLEHAIEHLANAEAALLNHGR